MCIVVLHNKSGAMREMALAVLVGMLEVLAPVEELDNQCLCHRRALRLLRQEGCRHRHRVEAATVA
ncbi:hypothetical protein ACP4OV_006923 [Aristida adscensionis]